MIEISAKLIKGPVYVSGELLECIISFTHPFLKVHKKSHDHKEIYESLAWASAQIICKCSTTLDNTTKKPEDLNSAEVTADTSLVSLRNAGQNDVATSPKILFCDLQLFPGQTKTYVFREKVPSDAPPSYRGQMVKFSYNLVIGTQRVGCPVRLMKVPIRVLPMCPTVLSEIGGLCNDTSEDLTPSNPFLEVKESDKSFELAIQTLQNITSRRNPNFYMISNTRGKVARFCLFKPAYKLGEDIIGTFDFTIATVTCVQFSVSLQCVEEAKGKPEPQARTMTFSKQHEVCLGLKYTQLVLPVPLHVTPAFSTSWLDVNWRIHFEFVMSTNGTVFDADGGRESWQAPGEVPIETMVWSLPIKLFSTTPVQVSFGLQPDSAHKLVIH